MAGKNENFKVFENNEVANVFITNRVIEEIAAIAALDIEGIAIDYDKKQGRKMVQKGVTKVLPKKVRVDVDGKTVKVDMNINVIYGYNVVEVSQKVQAKVKEKIEAMTSMTVENVNIAVDSVRI